MKRYIEPGRAVLVWHDFQFLGEESRQAAQGARCAARQGKFWEYHGAVYANQGGVNKGSFGRGTLEKFAADIGLNGQQFSTCLERGEDLADIAAKKDEGRTFGVEGTPTLFANGKKMVGLKQLSDIYQLVDGELATLRR